MVDGPDEDFTLKLSGNGVSIDTKVNRQIAMAVVAAVMSGGTAALPAGRADADGRQQTKASISPREFLNEVRASSNAEQITALGHYFCHHEAKENFSKDEIREGFRRAHEVIPRNLPRDVGTAVKSGWIHEAPGKGGRYYVTNTGMQLVEAKFGRAK